MTAPPTAQTMLRDIEALRKAIRQDHDIVAADAALDRCERWFDQLRPGAMAQARRDALTDAAERLMRANPAAAIILRQMARDLP